MVILKVRFQKSKSKINFVSILISQNLGLETIFRTANISYLRILGAKDASYVINIDLQKLLNGDVLGAQR